KAAAVSRRPPAEGRPPLAEGRQPLAEGRPAESRQPPAEGRSRGPPAARRRLRLDLLAEAGLEQLLAVHREERVDGVSHHAYDFPLTPGRMAHQIALLERPEHRPLDPLDLERAAAAGAAVTAHRLLEQRAPRGRIAVAPRRERRSDGLELTRGWR